MLTVYTNGTSRAVCHNILEFSARVLATFQFGNLRVDAIPGKIPL
ncbi:MAG: hypothetical protein ABGZ35_20950 [Planctomycetaceae bacterium]